LGAAARAMAFLTPGTHELHLLAEDDATGGVVHRRVELDQGYDRVAFDADGEHGVAWMGPGANQRDLISVVSQVAVLDVAALLEDGPGAVRERDLNLEEAPEKVEFSGSMTLFGAEDPLRLAAVVTAGRVAMLDLGRPELRARTIYLDAGVRPDIVRFTDGMAQEASAEFFLFSAVDSANSDRGISAYRILPEDDVAAAEALGEPRIRLTYDLLLPDDPPASFELFPDPSGRRLMVVSVGLRASRATVFELMSSSIGTTVGLPDGARASRVLRAPRPGRELAVLYDTTGTGGQERRLVYLDIDAASQGRPEAEVGEAFAERVRTVEPVPRRPGRLLVQLHDSPQIELVDLGGDTPRSTSIRLKSRQVPVWDSRGASFYVVSDDGDLLGRVSLDDQGGLSSTTVPLDSSPAAVYLLEGTGLVVVDHGVAHGSLTVTPAASLNRDSARVLEGLFLEGLLDQAAGRGGA